MQKSQVSVVIPVLNGAAGLANCLAALGSVVVAEVIVVDGGSADGSVAVALAAGAHVLSAPAGRGGQLRAGVAVAKGEFLLLLHADTVLAPGWDAVCLPAGKAGYFTFRLASGRWQARVLEGLVRLRCRVFALPYGDQGLLIHRDVLAAAGGVPEMALMEDVVLARRLGRQTLQALEVAAVTSAARYEQGGYFRRPLRNLFCLGLFLAGAPVGFIRRVYG